jgi:hypothetical protein
MLIFSARNAFLGSIDVARQACVKLATREAANNTQTTKHMVSLSQGLTSKSIPRRRAVNQREQSNPPMSPATTGFDDSLKMSLQTAAFCASEGDANPDLAYALVEVFGGEGLVASNSLEES